MPYVSGADYNPVTISGAERSTLSSALAAFAESFNTLVVHARESSWSDGSRAVQWMQTSDELPTPNDVGEVRLLIGHLLSRCLAAVDHVRGAAAVTVRVETSVSMATVTRGCIESLAKASYVLTASGAVDAVRKNLRMIRGEMRYLGKYSEVDAAGEPVDAAVLRETINEVSARFGVTDDASVTQLAAALLDRGAPEGRHYYSHISSFAHGEVDSINMFLTPNNLSTPELPLEYAVEWAGMCIGTSIIIGRDIVEFFGVDETVLRQWNAAIESALSALRTLRRAGQQPGTAEEK